MRRVLHLLTGPQDETICAVLTKQASQPELVVETVDLTSDAVNYDAVVEKIFAADMVAVW